MPSARTQCPACHGDANVVDLRDLLYSPQVDYFRCRGCGCWWMVSKGEDGPPTLIALGNRMFSAREHEASGVTDRSEAGIRWRR